MHKVIFSLMLLFLSCSVMAQQIFFPFSNEPFAAYWIKDSINFETQSASQLVIVDSLWQIGLPQKAFLNQAWSLPYAIITDTHSIYPDYAYASFHFRVNPLMMINLFVSFDHKVDIGQGDSCFIELSADGSQWYGLSSFFNYFVSWGTFTVGETNLISNVSEFHYYQDQPEDIFYTDTVMDWTQTSLWLQWLIPVKDEQALFTDSLFVRFRFVSDENSSNSEGWMIDNIYIGEFSVGSGINNNEISNCKYLQILPNPANDFISFDETVFHFPVNVIIYDLSGKTLIFETLNSNLLNVSNLQNGQYFIKFIDFYGKHAYSKIHISK